MTPPDPTEFAQAQQLDFQNGDLLQRAFVHRSYLNEMPESGLADNERLEFLGDAVLEWIVSELLFLRFPRYAEGDLTNLRAALVRRETLARLARRLRLGDYLLLGHGEEESGGRQRPATLCATFEAVVGALYLDGGSDAAREFVLRLLEPEVERLQQRALAKDPKSRLQEWVQSTFGQTPRYKTVAMQGPDHDRTFVIQVSLDKQPVGVGTGRSKQAAAQQAAAQALHRHGLPAPEWEPNEALMKKWTLAEVSDVL